MTDGAKDAGANTGGDGSLVDVMMRGGGKMETMLTDGGNKGELPRGGVVVLLHACGVTFGTIISKIGQYDFSF